MSALERIKQCLHQCPVCLGTVGTSSWAETPCGHRFCTSCLSTSLSATRGTCPMCRKAVDRFETCDGPVLVLRLRNVSVADAPRPSGRQNTILHIRYAVLWLLLPLAMFIVYIVSGSGDAVTPNVVCSIENDGGMCVYVPGDVPQRLAHICHDEHSRLCDIGGATCLLRESAAALCP